MARSARAVEERKRRKVQLALAASVLAMLLGDWGVRLAGGNEQAQRACAETPTRRNAEAVAGARWTSAEEALRAGDAAKAAVALEAAQKRSAEGGAEKEAKRLERLDADLALLRDLDAVDQFRWTSVENKFPDAAAVAMRTREALGRFGADPDAVSVDDAAAAGVRVGGAGANRVGPGSSVTAREDDRRACPARAGGRRRVPGRGPGCDPRRGTGEVRGTGGTSRPRWSNRRGSSPSWARAGRSPWSGGGSCCRRR